MYNKFIYRLELNISHLPGRVKTTSIANFALNANKSESCKIIVSKLSVNVCSKIRTRKNWALGTRLPDGGGEDSHKKKPGCTSYHKRLKNGIATYTCAS